MVLLRRRSGLAGACLASLLACALAVGVVARAQDAPAWPAMPPPDASMAAQDDELAVWELVSAGRYVKAREAAEVILRARPQSYVAHLALAHAQHYGEANFPRALFEVRLALRHFEAAHGTAPGLEKPWRWHARILREIAATEGDLDHHEAKLGWLARHDALYEPRLPAERAWPLMKLGRFDEARRAARAGIESDSGWQRAVGLNALCAIEFEAADDGRSYEACRAALDDARASGQVSAVDLTNFAEASRSLFLLDEAEQMLLEAADAQVSWYGNPHLELAELYLREARFTEALGALRRVPPYRAQRPPHARDADRNESRRALAAFFVVVGRPDDARRITERALVMPDRRAHNSRDPAQDRAIVALLDRRARLLAAELLAETSASQPLWERPFTAARAAMLRLEAWSSGRQAARLLADDARLVGSFRIGTSRGAVMPPWLVGDLVEVMGAGVVHEALRRARAGDRRTGAPAYYDAFGCEVALAQGDDDAAEQLGARALSALPPAEALLRARVYALRAEAATRRGDRAAAARAYDAAFQGDPGIFRRLGVTVPVRFAARSGEVSDAVRELLEDSPRLDEDDDAALAVQIEGTASSGRACLVGAGGAVLGCGTATARRGDDTAALARRIAAAFHTDVFAPRIDLTQSDVGSLDGSNRVSRDPLEGIDADGLDADGLDLSGAAGTPGD
jgi:tetratricopeptide (TPR) repeat protein